MLPGDGFRFVSKAYFYIGLDLKVYAESEPDMKVPLYKLFCIELFVNLANYKLYVGKVLFSSNVSGSLKTFLASNDLS